MTEITRHHTPDTNRATGLMPPVVRAVAHLGYMLGYLDEHPQDELDEEMRNDMRGEIDQILRHTDDSLGIAPGAFVSAPAVEDMIMTRSELEAFKEAIPTAKTDAMRDVQTLIHNFAHVAATVEHDVTGLHSQEGIQT